MNAARIILPAVCIVLTTASLIAGAISRRRLRAARDDYKAATARCDEWVARAEAAMPKRCEFAECGDVATMHLRTARGEGISVCHPHAAIVRADLVGLTYDEPIR